MGMLLLVFAIPFLSLALVVWAVASRRLADGPRRATMVAAILLACGALTLVRTDGITATAIASSTGAGRRRPRSGCWPRPRDEPDAAPAGSAPPPRRRADAPDAAPARRASQPPRRQAARRRRRHCRAAAAPATGTAEPSGPAFADPSATASFAACGSRPTGPRRRRSSCGAGRSDRAGRRSPSTAISSTRRSSAARTRSSPATTLTHRRAGVAAPRRGAVLGIEWRRRSARDADAQQRPRLHARRDRHPERARRRHRRRRLVAQRGGRHRRAASRAGASRARRWWSTTSSSSPPSGRLAAYDVATGKPRWSARPAAAATARRTW